MQSHHTQQAAQGETLWTQLFVALETAVLERVDQTDTFSLQGTAPAWWASIFGTITPPLTVRPGERAPFLKQFLGEAEQGWAGHSAGLIRSGPWTERDPQHARPSPVRLLLRIA